MNPKNAIIPGITKRYKPIAVLAEPALSNRKAYDALTKPFMVLSVLAIPWVIAFVLAFAWVFFSEFQFVVENLLDAENRWFVLLAVGVNAAKYAVWGGLALSLFFVVKLFASR